MKQSSTPPSPEDNATTRIDDNTAARIQVYRLLAAAFRYPIDDFFENLVDGKCRVALSETLSMSSYHDSPFEEELLKLMEKIEASLAQMNFEDYEVLFAETFEVGAPAPPCPPYEGSQRKSLPRNAAMLQISAFYKHFGLKMDQKEGKRELPDHISAELEFLQFLTFKEAQARGENDEKDDKELLTGYLLAQTDFLRRHPLRWISSFANKLAEIRPGEAPSLFAELTTLFLHEEWDLAAGRLKEMGVDVEPLDKKLLHVTVERPVDEFIPFDDPMDEGPNCNGCGPSD